MSKEKKKMYRSFRVASQPSGLAGKCGMRLHLAQLKDVDPQLCDANLNRPGLTRF